jgi:hypothetical protein
MPAIQLKNISKETYQFIIKLQDEMKIKRNCLQYSQAKTVMNIIEEYKKIKEKGVGTVNGE